MKNMRRGMLAAAALGLTGCDSLEKVYEREVRAELEKPGLPAARFTEGTVAGLPEPVRRYLRFAGWMEREIPRNARLVWGDFRFPRQVSATWHEPEGDFEYARGTLARIEYDVREP